MPKKEKKLNVKGKPKKEDSVEPPAPKRPPSKVKKTPEKVIKKDEKVP